jgi:hypothetical protein
MSKPFCTPIITLLLFASHAIGQPKTGIFDIEKAEHQISTHFKIDSIERSATDTLTQLKNEWITGFTKYFSMLRNSCSPSKEPLSQFKKEEKDLARFINYIDDSLSLFRAEMYENIFHEKINAAIAAYGKKHGFSMILNSRNVLYFDNDVPDITKEAIDSLFKKKVEIRQEIRAWYDLRIAYWKDIRKKRKQQRRY